MGIQDLVIESYRGWDVWIYRDAKIKEFLQQCRTFVILAESPESVLEVNFQVHLSTFLPHYLGIASFLICTSSWIETKYLNICYHVRAKLVTWSRSVCISFDKGFLLIT